MLQGRSVGRLSLTPDVCVGDGSSGHLPAQLSPPPSLIRSAWSLHYLCQRSAHSSLVLWPGTVQRKARPRKSENGDGTTPVGSGNNIRPRFSSPAASWFRAASEPDFSPRFLLHCGCHSHTHCWFPGKIGKIELLTLCRPIVLHPITAIWSLSLTFSHICL